eukprot:g4883.t1
MTMKAHFAQSKGTPFRDGGALKADPAPPSTPQRPVAGDSAASAAASAETPLRPFQSRTSAAVNALYSTVQQATGALGGNASGGEIYGEITKSSVQRILDAFREHCDFGAGAAFLDIGAGLGKPNFHASVDGALRVSVGVEIDRVRWYLSLVNLRRAIGTFLPADAPRVAFLHADITAARRLDPFTHVYMFDTGFPPAVSRTIAAAFNRSTATRYMACFHNPRLVLGDWGLEAELVDKIQTSMAGSSEGHTAFIYRKLGAPPPSSAVAASPASAPDALFARSLRLLNGSMD